MTRSGDTLALSGAINGSGTLTKSGGGILIVSGNNVYIGGTTLTGGTLLINNTLGSGTGSGAVNVNGGTLGGTGSIAGSVTVNNGGTLAAGAPITSLSVGGNVTFGNGSTFAYEMNHSADLPVAGYLQMALGDLYLTDIVMLSINDHSDPAYAPNTTLTLINYGKWNGGFFTYEGHELDNNAEFTAGNNTWKIIYDATCGGANYTGADTGNFINLTNNLTSIPEPATWLALSCLLGAGFSLRSRPNRNLT